MTDSRSDRFVRSHLKTRHLVLLVELGRHGSIAHAAQAANLTQPGASKLLGELEHALGVQLFERLSRGVSPTWYGKVLIRRAGAALAEMDAAHQEVMELLSGLRGRVGIGTVLAPATGLVPKAINLLKGRHARVHVAVTMSTSKVLVERLRSGELDLVVGRILDTEAADELNFEPLTDEPHLLIARASHPLMGRSDLTLEDLMEQCWILPPAGSILRDRLTALFLSHGLEQPAETVETLDMPVVASLLLNNDMVVALPAEAVQPYLDAGLLKMLPFDLGVSMDSFGIVTRKRHQLSPGADAMLIALRDAAASIYPHYRAPVQS
ncbi:LysR substrate-binding domain-containing protein [Duganella sp. BuS-21]|uniref:LysR substrate-binding domain-containing protein n=1 Tax=Duganella sp. BuS-21 TaxID=2943848 RepID=UPI0035A68E49